MQWCTLVILSCDHIHISRKYDTYVRQMYACEWHTHIYILWKGTYTYKTIDHTYKPTTTSYIAQHRKNTALAAVYNMLLLLHWGYTNLKQKATPEQGLSDFDLTPDLGRHAFERTPLNGISCTSCTMHHCQRIHPWKWMAGSHKNHQVKSGGSYSEPTPSGLPRPQVSTTWSSVRLPGYLFPWLANPGWKCFEIHWISLGNSGFAKANRSNFLDVFFPQVVAEFPWWFMPRFARHGDIHQAPIDQTLVLR